MCFDGEIQVLLIHKLCLQISIVAMANFLSTSVKYFKQISNFFLRSQMPGIPPSLFLSILSHLEQSDILKVVKLIFLLIQFHFKTRVVEYL